MKSRTSWLLALSLAASGAFAQTLYKSTMPDGTVTYSANPVPGAKQVDKVAPPPPKSGMSTITPQERARAEQLSRERATTGKSQNNLEEARRQLQQAEAARESGKEPLPGERLGTAGGGSRLTDEYFARQKSLEEAAVAARKRLDQAQGR